MLMLIFEYVLGLAPLLRAQENEKPAFPQPAVRFVRQVLPGFSNPRLTAKLLVPQMLFSLGGGLRFPFLHPSYGQRLDVSDGTLGWIFGIMDIVVALMTLWAAVVAEHQGKIWSLLIAHLLATPVLFVRGFVSSLPVAVTTQRIRGGLSRLGEPLCQAFVIERFDDNERVTGGSLLQMRRHSGQALGPHASGHIQMRAGLGAVSMAATVLFAGVRRVFIGFLGGRERRRNLFPSSRFLQPLCWMHDVRRVVD